MTTGEPKTESSQEQTVPESLPPLRTDVPRTVRTVRGLLALPLMVPLCIFPKRFGPLAAVAGWRAAVAAHLFGLLFGVGLCAWGELNATWYTMRSVGFSGATTHIPLAQMTVSEFIRAPFAALVVHAHGNTVGASSLFAAIGGLVAFELSLLVVAIATMPFAAAGESNRRLFGRCVRLTWWSTTMLVPLGIGWAADVYIRPAIGLPNAWHPLDFVGIALFVLWWLTVLLRSSLRYAGPPDGPAWQPRTPRCEGCGYNLAHLDPTGRCPECGRPVSQSLPGRRQIPTWRRNRTAQESGDPPPTVWSVFRDPQFFERLSVARGHSRARAVFLLACAVCAFTIFASGVTELIYIGPLLLTNVRSTAADAFTACCAVAVAIILLVGIATAAYTLLVRRPMHLTSVPALYAASIVITAVAVAVPWSSIFAPAVRIFDGRAVLWVPIPVATVFATAGLTLYGLLALKCRNTLRSARRDTRHAAD